MRLSGRSDAQSAGKTTLPIKGDKSKLLVQGGGGMGEVDDLRGNRGTLAVGEVETLEWEERNTLL